MNGCKYMRFTSYFETCVYISDDVSMVPPSRGADSVYLSSIVARHGWKTGQNTVKINEKLMEMLIIVRKK